ncbi:UDP-N-acetylmuramoyl-L-alanine--D-glutamate ligase [Sandaracinus amylolyticus]|uniref:UDP-N-acetylmuramoyl-L-alanine--D-glutamate ligase n=1 Tax=Sandaracinus amylolyticus TaxID=927083 RepID=UPI0009F8C3AA|nr:UDP-N-acetylmuramoyl-L-alanine--D-glutamate ligase [Sandaracinus amylolyticus]
MLDLAGKRLVVVGGGKSGLAAARLAAKAGARVTINDKKSEAEASALVADARAIDVDVVLGGHPESLFAAADVIVLSPGVPSLAVVDAAEKRGAKVIPEVELAAHFLRGTLIGITGSNGKSTVTTLVGEMCAASGRPSFTGGNLGDALALAVGTEAAESKKGLVVAELSSFQLERIETMRCHIAACLNVTEDHLDRHGTFAAYAAAKGRIFLTQTTDDHAIVPAGDELCIALARAGAAKLHTFGGADGEVRVEDGVLVDTVSGLRFPVAKLRIRGLHNQANACAAALAARLAGVPREAIEDVLARFAGLPHRMVHVRDLDGVVYYDDSKATNVGATVAALDGLADLEGRVVLIAGGVDKGGSYAPVRERMERIGRALVLIGEAAPLISSAFEGSPIERIAATTIDDAVAKARAVARAGDAVLLAPACASFDMFRSYAHRGDEFARAVRALPEAI